MKLGQSPEGKWRLLDDNKNVVQEFDSRVDAVEALKAFNIPKEEVGCKHGNRLSRDGFYIPNPDFPHPIERVWSELRTGYGEIKPGSGQWATKRGPLFLESFYGQLCRDCGLVVLDDGSTRTPPESFDKVLKTLDDIIQGMLSNVPRITGEEYRKASEASTRDLI